MNGRRGMSHILGGLTLGKTEVGQHIIQDKTNSHFCTYTSNTEVLRVFVDLAVMEENP